MYHLPLGGLRFVNPFVSTECLEYGEGCAFAAIIDTQFVDNNATSAGGAIFAEYLEAIRFRCSTMQTASNLEFLDEEDWIGLETLTSQEQFCDTWENNEAAAYGRVVGSCPRRVNITIDDSQYDVDMRSEHEYIIKRYRAREELPEMTLQFIDGLNQVTSVGYFPNTSTKTSPSVEFTMINASPQVHEDRISFPNMIGFGPPGTYKLMIVFDSKAIQDLTVSINVRECIIGEVTTNPDTEMCSNCSYTEYSFNPKEDRCRPCPVNGICETRVIVPDEGYWQSNPCSTHIKKCLAAHACTSENRSDALHNKTDAVVSCDMSHNDVLEYRRMQCAEARHPSTDVEIKSHFFCSQGHSGPLCGSCDTGYGSLFSSRCKRCPVDFVSILMIGMSVVIVSGLTAITIQGTLSTVNHRRSALSGRGRRSLSNLSTPSARDSAEHIESQHGHRRGRNRTLSEQMDGVPTSERMLAKWKGIEMLKV